MTLGGGIPTLALLLFTGVLAGCSVPEDRTWRHTPPHPDRLYPPPESPPPIGICTDAIGHQPGSRPFIFGGTCCCNPTVELLDAYHRQGILEGWTVDALRSAYGTRGIATLEDHRDCNNLCRFGPHLVKGGRCLVPPTPGTLNHEEVIANRFALTPWEARRVEAHGGPIEASPMPGREAPEETEGPVWEN
ncbi:MAG: hypothetical protein ACE5GW_00800 [Planctomycetota bacterium]